MSIPFFVLALTLASIFDPSLWSVILILAITSWPRYARMARSQAITLRGISDTIRYTKSPAKYLELRRERQAKLQNLK